MQAGETADAASQTGTGFTSGPSAARPQVRWNQTVSVTLQAQKNDLRKFLPCAPRGDVELKPSGAAPPCGRVQPQRDTHRS